MLLLVWVVWMIDGHTTGSQAIWQSVSRDYFMLPNLAFSLLLLLLLQLVGLTSFDVVVHLLAIEYFDWDLLVLIGLERVLDDRQLWYWIEEVIAILLGSVVELLLLLCLHLQHHHLLASVMMILFWSRLLPLFFSLLLHLEAILVQGLAWMFYIKRSRSIVIWLFLTSRAK